MDHSKVHEKADKRSQREREVQAAEALVAETKRAAQAVVELQLTITTGVDRIVERMERIYSRMN